MSLNEEQLDNKKIEREAETPLPKIDNISVENASDVSIENVFTPPNKTSIEQKSDDMLKMIHDLQAQNNELLKQNSQLLRSLGVSKVNDTDLDSYFSQFLLFKKEK